MVKGEKTLLKCTLMSIFLLFSVTSQGRLSEKYQKVKASKINRDVLLDYSTLSNLTPGQRAKYLKGVAKVLTYLSEEEGKFSILNNLQKILFNVAYASSNGSGSKYRCIGGGLPILTDDTYADSPKDQVCGAQSFEGFNCAEGKEICNPCVFGASSSGEPVCHETASTKWCYKNTRVGQEQVFSDSKFKTENMARACESTREKLNDLCSGDESITESRNFVSEACNMLERQRRVTEARLGQEGFNTRFNNDPSRVDTYSRDSSQYNLGVDVSQTDELGSSQYEEYPIGRRVHEEADFPFDVEQYLGDEDSYNEFRDLYAKFSSDSNLTRSKNALARALAFYVKRKDGGLNECSGRSDSTASANLRNQDWIVISDLTLRRSQRRIFFLNVRTGEVRADWSSHGSGSQRSCTSAERQRYNIRNCEDIPLRMGEDVGQTVEARDGSNTTRGGFYETRNQYSSSRTRTYGDYTNNGMRLVGLQPSNYDARSNAVVMHGASYVSEGNAGRSWGCPTMQQETFQEMRSHIDNGALLYIHTINEKEGEPQC